MSATVIGLARDGQHRFSKQPCTGLTLLAGLGVEGDAHSGRLVQHLSRVAKDPNAPNLRQVHLIHAELFDELAAQGFDVLPGQLGENITTRGIDLLDLPRGTQLKIGEDAIIELTGLRNPCRQIDGLKPGLMAATLAHADDGSLIRKAGIMAVVIAGGKIQVGHSVEVLYFPLVQVALEPV